jgi:DNA-binding MarR family transcriptional regulator
VQEPSDAAVGADETDELARQRVLEFEPGADVGAMSLMFNLVRLADRVTQDFDTLHRPRGFSWAGFRILFWLWILGPLEPRRIADLTSSSRARISAVLKTLERDGFVERRRDSRDGRLVTVALTAQGRERIDRAFVEQNALESGWVAALDPEEQKQLAGLLKRLVDSVNS